MTQEAAGHPAETLPRDLPSPRKIKSPKTKAQGALSPEPTQTWQLCLLHWGPPRRQQPGAAGSLLPAPTPSLSCCFFYLPPFRGPQLSRAHSQNHLDPSCGILPKKPGAHTAGRWAQPLSGGLRGCEWSINGIRRLWWETRDKGFFFGGGKGLQRENTTRRYPERPGDRGQEASGPSQ